MKAKYYFKLLDNTLKVLEYDNSEENGGWSFEEVIHIIKEQYQVNRVLYVVEEL